MPSPFSVWVHIVSPPYVGTSHMYVRKNGFHLISFEKINVLDSFFIHRYIVMFDLG